ncbi:MAG: alanine racemase [Candidatus Omnitrophica bacterium]|nr:alanine racemase [Candidatus Omnitrophota bacterium]
MNTKEIGYRPTWAEINLGDLAHNFRQIKKLLAMETKVMACVKADAYGHGLIAVARALVSCGVDHFGVASIDEGIAIRKNNIRKPILVMGAVLRKDILPLFTYGLTPTVCSLQLARALNGLARKKRRVMDIHIKVDTGMGRLGVLASDALPFIQEVQRSRFLRIAGVFTHFPCADTDRDFTLAQIDIFKKLITDLRHRGIRIPLAHAANSMGLIAYKESHFDMVRPGLAIYGLYPKAGLKVDLKPVLSLKTQVTYLKKVPSGYGISYGRTYVARKDTTIATLPIGYGDGYPRILSGRAPVLIRGRRLRIESRICMDQMMTDVANIGVKVGDEAVLIGSQGKNKITAQDLARLSKTISYEIVCGLGSRIPRVYK